VYLFLPPSIWGSITPEKLFNLFCVQRSFILLYTFLSQEHVIHLTAADIYSKEFINRRDDPLSKNALDMPVYKKRACPKMKIPRK
jgi:hypothetical protein